MLASITPLGERARGQRWGLTMVAYVAGSTVGGLIAGAVFGAAGDVSRLDGIGLLGLLGASIALVAALTDSSRVRLPSVHRQVNEDWLVRYRGWVYGGGFGFQLGLGVVTVVPTAAVYAAWGLAVLTGSIGGGAAIGAAFGFTRALPVIGAAWVRTPARLRAFHRRMQTWAPRARWGTIIALGLIGVGAAVAG
jgi:hypothetical protein